MFNFFKKKESDKLQPLDIITKTASLLIHAAKIDENYTKNEKIIIKKTLVELGANSEKLNDIMELAEKNERWGKFSTDNTKDLQLIHLVGKVL